MKHISNEKKAREIARGLNFSSDYPHDYKSAFDGAILMGKWKDEQQWKPTEKQLDALLDCANNSTRKNFLELNALYEELVKLYYDKR